MVGLQSLDLPVGVRIPASQLLFPTNLAFLANALGFPL